MQAERLDVRLCEILPPEAPTASTRARSEDKHHVAVRDAGIQEFGARGGKAQPFVEAHRMGLRAQFDACRRPGGVRNSVDRRADQRRAKAGAARCRSARRRGRSCRFRLDQQAGRADRACRHPSPADESPDRPDHRPHRPRTTPCSSMNTIRRRLRQVAISRRACDPRSCEILPQDAGVDRLQLMDLRHLDPFIDLMHGLAHQPEFHHRAVIFDKPRIRGAARGRVAPAPRPVSACTARPPAPRTRPAGSESFRPRSGSAARSPPRLPPAPRRPRPRSQSDSDAPEWVSLKRMFTVAVPRPGSRWSPDCRSQSW